MQRVFSAFMDTVNGVARSTLPASMAEEFTQRLQVRLHGWEDRVEQDSRTARP